MYLTHKHKQQQQTLLHLLKQNIKIKFSNETADRDWHSFNLNQLQQTNQLTTTEHYHTSLQSNQQTNELNPIYENIKHKIKL